MSDVCGCGTWPVFLNAQLQNTSSLYWKRLKPGVHTNDFAPIHRLRALKLGHASLATAFRPGRLTLQPILRENLESPVLRYQPITTAVVTDACLNTRWHHGAYTSAVLRESLGLDRVVTVYAELSGPDWLATVQSGRKQVQSRVCTPSFRVTSQLSLDGTVATIVHSRLREE